MRAVLTISIFSCLTLGCNQAPAQGIVGQDSLPESVTVVTDQNTQCEYLMGPSGSLTPRLGQGGKPRCGTAWSR